MRIVGGALRGRALLTPEDRAVRPTADRVREALFNVLAHAAWAPDLDGLTVLDACCGTGALGFEALSRGAAMAMLLDSDAGSLGIARRNADALGLAGRCRFLRADATKPGPAPAAAGLVLIDPPYRSGIVSAALPALAAGGWLAPGAIVAAEDEDDGPPLAVPGFDWLDGRRWGRARIDLLRWPGQG